MSRRPRVTLACLLTAVGLLGAGPPVAVAASARPYSYLRQPTDQLVVPGQVAGTEVTPEGYLHTGWGELVFRYGSALAPWRQTVRILDAGRLPVLTSVTDRGGVRYTLTVLATLVKGQQVNLMRLGMRNVSSSPRPAVFSTALRWSDGRRGTASRGFLRPVTPSVPGLQWQPGAAFDPAWRYAMRSGAVTRDGRVMLLVHPGRGVREAALTHGAGRGPAAEHGALIERAKLAPGAAVTVGYVMPVLPSDPAAASVAAMRRVSFEGARRAVDAGWGETFSRALAISTPERVVTDTFYASLRTILEARYVSGADTVQAVNLLQYHAFWLRDAAMMTNALDRAGLHEEAAANLGYFAAWQRPDGLFISRPNQYDGIGEALWTLGEHARRTGDATWAASQIPAIDRAVAWIARARALDHLGLLPASDPHDNERVRGHLVGDDFWALDGLSAVADLARVAGQPQKAAAWEIQAQDLRLAVGSAVTRATKGGRLAIPPALDVSAGQDWGNLWAAWPDRALDPASAPVTATLRSVRRRFAEGLATYRIRHRALHGYLGFRVFETELARGEQRAAVAGLYASLTHTTATHGGFETGVLPYAKRDEGANLTPHGWFAAEYVELLRNMLVREDAGHLDLLSALPSSWLAPGRRVTVAGAPTIDGPVDVSLVSHSGGATLRWRAPHAPAGSLRWAVPASAAAVKAAGRAVTGSWVALSGSHGTLEISWRLRDRRPESFTAAARALADAYRARGLSPPAGA